MPDITVTYEGNTIATMSASGTKTFYTAGKYCDDDITLTYVSPGGGGGVNTGTFTPAARTDTVSFDIGVSSFTGLLIIPTENPLLSGGKTFVGGYLSANDGYWKTFFGTTNNAGSSLLAPATSTSGITASIAGTVVTVNSYQTATPTINAGQFETITYRWYAW